MKLIKYYMAGEYWDLVILDTPCYPARYYAGWAKNMGLDLWNIASNATGNYYRTLEEAEKSCEKTKSLELIQLYNEDKIKCTSKP